MPKKLSHKIFHSKLLLFGEHIINKGATGLAVPFEHFDGILKLGDLKNKEIKKSNRSIEKLAKHIIDSDELAPLYDTNSLLEHLEKGLYFDSNIPQGYGLGSSGALVAALYQQYRKPEKKKRTVSEIKNELSLVESYFHGRSSGLDPIVCYLNKAVLIGNGEVTETDELAKSKSPALKIFLINTHIERSTSPYVNLFLEKCKDKKFMDTVQKSLISTNDIAVDSFLHKKHVQLMKCVKLISQLHLDLMPEFIPDKFKDIWKQGLKFNEYHLKICGAGGGGFIIGFAKADARLDLLLNGYDIIEWMKF